MIKIVITRVLCDIFECFTSIVVIPYQEIYDVYQCCSHYSRADDDSLLFIYFEISSSHCVFMLVLDCFIHLLHCDSICGKNFVHCVWSFYNLYHGIAKPPWLKCF